METIVRQIWAAHAWLYRNCERYDAPRNRIYVSGHSAGGQLTAMMLAAVWPAYARGLPDDLVKGGLAVGGDESVEFRRQNRLIAARWAHCFRRDIPMPGCHHLSVIERLGDPGSALFAGALEMMGPGRLVSRPPSRHGNGG